MERAFNWASTGSPVEAPHASTEETGKRQTSRPSSWTRKASTSPWQAAFQSSADEIPKRWAASLNDSADSSMGAGFATHRRSRSLEKEILGDSLLSRTGREDRDNTGLRFAGFRALCRPHGQFGRSQPESFLISPDELDHLPGLKPFLSLQDIESRETVFLEFNLKDMGLEVPVVHRNLSPARLYEEALSKEKDSAILSNGALTARSGHKTGRSPTDKRIVEHPDSKGNIWWGDINIPVDEHVFMINRERAMDYLNTRSEVYVVDGFAGWDETHRLKVRIVCSRPYHALFMHNMLIRPTAEELENFGKPDYIVWNGGKFPANRYTAQMSSTTSVDLSLERKEIVILGTEYAGEMKKGVFTVMNYLMPEKGVLSMHCSANEGDDGKVSLFFGLSGTGKTTLSADPQRKLIGDDEHCWTEKGVFNIEGGCYAKCIGLRPHTEPEIYEAIRFGSLLENVVFDPDTREVDYDNDSLTQNTRASYPIEYIPNAKIPCIGGHPNHIILLTCDAFGVLPPVSRLSPEQAMYHFTSGYTAKVAGTEQGVTEPKATFSACFGAAFMVWHPSVYAELLAKKMREHGAKAWLVNTGWSGGGYGVGKRINLPYTRAIIDAIHDGSLDSAPVKKDDVFGFDVVTECNGVPSEILWPRNTWSDKGEYDKTAAHLAQLFQDNFKKFSDGCSEDIRQAGPKAPVTS